jgi:hypothetical protein
MLTLIRGRTTIRSIALLLAGGIGLASAGLVFALAQPPVAVTAVAPPAIEDFLSLASADERTFDAASNRIAPRWKDSYAGLVIDLARFFRPARPIAVSGAAGAGEVNADDAGPARPETDDRMALSDGAPLSQEAQIRGRLMRFLSKQTGQRLGDDLKRWRRWLWSLPDAPHPDYARFKARLYANVDPRMATFFQATTKARIRLDEIDWGGVGVNGIPPLHQPMVIRASEAKFMGDRNVVFGIVVNGEARAYPKRILAWHEMALDTVGGVPLAIVYCTLCGTVIPYEASSEGRAFTFGTSGLLYRSNKLMFDMETKSLWSTIEGRPVVGPLERTSLALRYRPVVTTSWAEWRAAHPATTVLSLDTGHQRDYREGAAYRGYFATDELMFEVPGQDGRLKKKAEVVTFLAGDGDAVTPVALDAAFLKKNPVHMFSAGGLRYVAITTSGGANRIYRAGEVAFVRMNADKVFDAKGAAWMLTEESLEGESGASMAREPARRTFWFAWSSQFPSTILMK